MDKQGKKAQSNLQKVDKEKNSQDHEDYGYDFVPHLNEWVNIDEQKEKTKQLEDI